jgi:hypothetical protein
VLGIHDDLAIFGLQDAVLVEFLKSKDSGAPGLEFFTLHGAPSDGLASLVLGFLDLTDNEPDISLIIWVKGSQSTLRVFVLSARISLTETSQVCDEFSLGGIPKAPAKATGSAADGMILLFALLDQQGELEALTVEARKVLVGGFGGAT